MSAATPVRSTPARRWSPTWLAVAALLAAAALVPLTADATSTTTNLWGTTVPENKTEADYFSVELGMRFFSDVPGTVTGVRFYKSRFNAGTHVGNLWDASGTKLASVTFTNETSRGWQSASFSKPVAITPKTTYVVSYFAPQGQYSEDEWYFTGKGRDRGSLHAPASTSAQRNGLYRYGPSSGFPTSSYHDSNYYVDVQFKAAEAGSTTATTLAATTTTVAPTTTTLATTATTLATTTTTVAPTTTTTATATTVPTATTSTTSGWPNATNTGVPPGTVLTARSGFTVTQDGAVLDRLDVTGCIIVQANNVTIRRSRVRGSCSSGTITSGGSNLLIEDTEVDGMRQNGYASLVSTSNYTCRRCNLHDGGQGFHAEFNVTVEDSYVHNIFGQSDSHNDGFVSNGGGPYVIRHNTISCEIVEPDPNGGCSAALAIYGDFYPVQDVLVENNLLGGGSFCTYGGSVDGKRYPDATNVDYVNNRFTRDFYPKCGEFGPVTAFDNNVRGNTWTGNVWHDTGQTISL